MFQVRLFLVAFVLVVGLFSVSVASRAEMGSSYSQCGAQTVCPVYCQSPYGSYLCNSYTIYCTSWAMADATACTYEWVAGNYVHCTGANSDGEWADFLVTCQ